MEAVAAEARGAADKASSNAGPSLAVTLDETLGENQKETNELLKDVAGAIRDIRMPVPIIPPQPVNISSDIDNLGMLVLNKSYGTM
jgi:hypothetical protein